MTTIAYRDGIMAADTLIHDRGLIVGTAPKIRRIGHLIAGGAGWLSDIQAFFGWLDALGNNTNPSKPQLESDFEGLVITPDKKILWYGSRLVQAEIMAPFIALGSGMMIATTAMHLGATAEQAVRTAIALNIQTGGEITVLKVGEA